MRPDVAIPETTPPLDQHDLDNHLFPLATHLSRTSGRRFVSAWGAERHASDSHLADPGLGHDVAMRIHVAPANTSTVLPGS